MRAGHGLFSPDRYPRQECRYPLLDSCLQWRPCSAYQKTLTGNEEDVHLKMEATKHISSPSTLRLMLAALTRIQFVCPFALH